MDNVTGVSEKPLAPTVKQGFTLRCNNCGKEVVFTKALNTNSTPNSENTFDIGVDINQEVSIECVCGNMLDED